MPVISAHLPIWVYDDAKEAKAILADFKPILTKEEYIAKLESYFNK